VAAVAVAAPSVRCPKGRLNRLASPLLLAARDIGREL
jgi:DNA-binding IclR family transcriptional regulator